MDPCMYIITNPNLGMSSGKLAAQVAHAAVEAFRLTGLHCSDEIISAWYRGGHYKKIVLQSNDLMVAERYLRDRGFRTVLIIDEGHTEFNGGLTPTAVGVPLVDKDNPHVSETFGTFSLYKDPKPEPPSESLRPQFEVQFEVQFEAPYDGSYQTRPDCTVPGFAYSKKPHKEFRISKRFTS